MPRMAYGLELYPLQDNSMGQLEQAHGAMAKMIQGQPKQTANVTPLATLGWRSFESHLHMLQLLFLWRLLLLPMSNVYKQLTLLRICYHLYSDNGVHMGPLWNILSTFKKYELVDILDDALKSGNVMPINVFKKLVRDIVDKKEVARFRITCMLYKSLPFYVACIQKIQIWPWWTFGDRFPNLLKKVRCLYRLMVGQSCIKTHTAHYDKSSSQCTLCDNNVTETADHLLFKCTLFQDTRNAKWIHVIDNAPIAMIREFERMSDVQKTKFILSGFSCDYTEEWCKLYQSVLEFCYSIYRARRQLNALN